MDILTHTFSGLAIGATITSVGNPSKKQIVACLFFSSLAGALPDIDAISLWSGFDGLFGELFNLQHSGRQIYSEKFWYSHHAFFHSLAAAFLFAFLLVLFTYIFRISYRKKTPLSFIEHIKQTQWSFIAFVMAYTMHLVEDMPTPASAWGGVNLFWPSETYLGGFGNIWWWNNYDIFLIIACVVFLNLALLALKKVVKIKLWKLSVSFFIIGFSLALFQIKTRVIDFSYSGNTQRYQYFEKQSKEIQKKQLGYKLYSGMEYLDKRLPFYF